MLPLTGTTYDAREKIWSGPRSKDMYSAEMTVGEAALIQLQKCPRKIIQVTDTTGETLTAQQLVDYSVALARNVLKLGLRPNDIVGLYAQNTTHVASVMMAAFLCGTPVNALFPGFEKDIVVQLYRVTRPKLIFCDVENYENARNAKEELQLKTTIILMNGLIEGVTNIEGLLAQQERQSMFDFPCVTMNSSDTAAILWSSGTTGTPKGVMCSHHALLHKNIHLSATDDSVLLCFSTMYWVSGVLNLVASLLNGHLRIVTDKPFAPEYFLYLVKRYRITHVFASGNQMTELVLKHSNEEIRQSLSSLDTLLCAGSKIPQPVQEKLLDILADNTQRPGFSILYGMSEITGGATFNGGPPFDFQPLTEGKLMVNQRMRIVDSNGLSLGPNESGEILIDTPYTWLGYYENAEATAKAFTGKWLHTGDVGYFDDLGYLHVSGRNKDMFKSNGFQICPQPIEDVIHRMAGVAEVCVFPVADFRAVNLTACAIVRTKDDEGVQLGEDRVREFAEQHLDSLYHLKGGIYFVDFIPKTSSGKIQRQLVAEMVNSE